MRCLSQKAGSLAKGVAIGVFSSLALPAVSLAGAPEVLDSAQLDNITAGYSFAVVGASGEATGASTYTSASGSTFSTYLAAQGSGSGLGAGTSSSAAWGAGTVGAGTASATVTGSAEASGDSTSSVVLRESARDGRFVDIAGAIIVASASGTDSQAFTTGDGSFAGSNGKVFVRTHSFTTRTGSRSMTIVRVISR